MTNKKNKKNKNRLRWCLGCGMDLADAPGRCECPHKLMRLRQAVAEVLYEHSGYAPGYNSTRNLINDIQEALDRYA